MKGRRCVCGWQLPAGVALLVERPLTPPLPTIVVTCPRCSKTFANTPTAAAAQAVTVDYGGEVDG